MTDTPRYRRTFFRLLGFLRPYKVSLAISIVFAVGYQASQIALIWLTKNVIDDALSPHDSRKLWTYVGAIVVLGGTWPTLVTVIVATVIWNGAFGGMPSIYQACAVRTHALSPELAGAWVNATANAGIAGGAAIGAGLLHAAGLSSLPWVGAALIGVSLGVILLSRRAFPATA